MANGKKLYFTAWQDSKPVHMLSTFPSYKLPVRRRTNRGNEWININVPRPTVIGVYNTGMGGTDKFDQLNSYYDSRLRTKKWQIRLYNHFLRAAVVNACILYNGDKKDPIPLITYFLHVIKHWCIPKNINDESGDEEGIKYASKKRTTLEYWSENYEFRSTGCHVPQKVKVTTNQNGHVVR